MTRITNKIVARFGGLSAVARICKITPSAVSQWKTIPARHQVKLLRVAKEYGVELAAADFFPTTRR